MLQRTHAAAIAIAMGAATLVMAPPASAAQAPSISKVSVSPASPVVFDKPVTATFTFTTKAAGKAELQLKAPGQMSVGTPVELKPSPHGQWTKWTGTRTFDAKDAGRWNLLAIAHGDGEKSANGTFEVRKALDTKVADFDADPDSVVRGERLRLSGRLLAEGRGYDGQTVTLTFREKGTDAYRHVAKVETGRGGWFGARVKAEATGWWRAEFAGNAAARGSVSDTDRVDVRRGDRDSRITGFDARPEPIDKGDRLRLSGTLQVDGGHALPGQRVDILFKATGSSRWERVTGDVTGRDGRFWASATAQESGWWRAVYRGTRGVDGTSSGSDWVRVVTPAPPAKADTRVISFNASPEPVKRGKYLRFKGWLQVDDEGAWEGYEGKVQLWFKAAGTRTWKYVKTTWSNDDGKLGTKTKASRSGTWKFVFRGDDDTNGDHSRTDYVRVKR
ncbi:5-hydroxyisourate hydrolase-like protein (transthyretin family) [Nonomuraea muscovyensis]|uniref:5-hydroxyisourate hydrolase-like protein (Transthyretin family) n=1 Tax=Nonomuraea muscovyensis TaxID=1124761 RepID=A0A7X0C5I7_9ACTN|nr:hypothetical protein [Nonomuraea muscovyensis]MBB6348910.1 5-hydroxyisourate hydrolase-like protein (transthyretin family) [Nonomuraea muscovyensis]